jgi:AraC-like DNA-binding protein
MQQRGMGTHQPLLLKHRNLLVFQISDELNFPNPSFFSKFFKRMTGMTPAEYQKQT